MVRHERTFIGDDHGPLEDIAQLAYVARPRIVHKLTDRVRMKIGHPAVMPSIQFRDHRLGNRWDVFLAVTQRRQRDMKYVEPVEQILPEELLLYCYFQRP